MSKREDQRIAKLARDNAAKAQRPKGDQAAKQYDPTLKKRAMEEDADAGKLFKEMKKREF